MFLYETQISTLTKSYPDAVIQFLTTSQQDNKPFAYCGKISQLFDDWMGQCINCPSDNDILLMATIYTGNTVHPIEGVGADLKITFKSLMIAIIKGIREGWNLE